eukprot:c55513_g1_i1 orf=164-316(+)
MSPLEASSHQKINTLKKLKTAHMLDVFDINWAAIIFIIFKDILSNTLFFS